MASRTRKIVALICLLAVSIGHLQADPMTAAQAFAEGKALGQGASGSAAGNITNGTIANTVNSFNPQYYQYSTTAPETQYFQGGNGDTYTPGASKITSCANDPANPDKFLQQNCDAINYMARNPATRPQFTINPNDPMILNSRRITANAGTLAAQSLGFADPSAVGSFTACQTTTTSTSPTYTTEVCNEYLSSTTNICTVGRDVVVDAQSNFQCNETTKAYETLKCKRSSSVTCTGGGDGCDQGGVVPNSWAGDMATKWSPDGAGNYIFQFGTIADNYWSGYGATFDRNLTFTVLDANLLTRFALTRAAFDDWLLVKINGTTVYVGPYGGDRLEYFYICLGWWDSGGPCDAYVQYGQNQKGSPELATSWNFTLNIDLRPYLRNGSNTIFMRTIVAGGGEGAIQITTRQRCPLICSVSTNNQCAALEARL